MGPTWSPETFKMEPKIDHKFEKSPPPPKKWSQEGARMAQKSKNNIDPSKRGVTCHSVPPFWRKMWPTWFQLGSQDAFQNGEKIDAKIDRKFDASWD